MKYNNSRQNVIKGTTSA